MKKTSLTASQKIAVEKFNKLKVGAIFMAMGTGKTLTALTLAENKKNEGKIDKVIYIAPLRTKKNFFEEVDKQNFSNLDIIFFGVESFSNSDRLYLKALELANERTMCIVDESLKIKNDSKRTERVIEIGLKCVYKLILNGTPISKNFFDLYHQMFFLSPKILKMSPEEFKNKFTTRIQKIKRGEVVKELIVSNENAGELYKIIEPYVCECELDLTVNKKNEVIQYHITVEESNDYYDLKNSLIKDIEMGSLNFLKIVQKMQHLYCCSIDKFEKIKKIVDDRTIIFCKFIDSQIFVKEKFPRALILSYQKHSFGLNLQKYNKIIFWDLTWDYATVEQAKARIYRKGQKQECRFYTLKSDTGLDSLIEKNIKNKVTDIVAFKEKFIKELMEEKNEKI